MTYRKLANLIANMSDEQKGCDVTIWDRATDEFYPSGELRQTEGDDRLDDDHPYITLFR